MQNISELVIAGEFSIWLLANPARGALAMLLFIGGYALIFGVEMIVHTLHLRAPAGRFPGD